MILLDRDGALLAEELAAPAPFARHTTLAAIARRPERCSLCSLRDASLPCDLLAASGGGEAAATHRRLKRGERLYRAGDEFRSLYTVRVGCFKTVQSLEGGRDQVTGFHMAGDLLGTDGIGTRIHASDAIALDDSRVCMIPYSRIEGDNRRLGQALHKALSREIVRQHNMLLLLGTMTAEERVAVFLLDLSQRLAAHGYSPAQINLRMTRREIGSYLGLKLETVSRILSRFRDEGMVSVEVKHLFIRDPDALRRCIGADHENSLHHAGSLHGAGHEKYAQADHAALGR